MATPIGPLGITQIEFQVGKDERYRTFFVSAQVASRHSGLWNAWIQGIGTPAVENGILQIPLPEESPALFTSLVNWMHTEELWIEDFPVHDRILHMVLIWTRADCYIIPKLQNELVYKVYALIMSDNTHAEDLSGLVNLIYNPGLFDYPALPETLKRFKYMLLDKLSSVPTNTLGNTEPNEALLFDLYELARNKLVARPDERWLFLADEIEWTVPDHQSDSHDGVVFG
ncbi:hypothetical protein BGZ60DRAFT_428648 [Tricladium varicosporioides]|nr:hypothetical protein BGZ60DRAFT_428648 [Hymenoscyphus varicosporioides]